MKDEHIMRSIDGELYYYYDYVYFLYSQLEEKTKELEILNNKRNESLELIEELKEKYFNRCVAGGVLDMMNLQNILKGDNHD